RRRRPLLPLREGSGRTGRQRQPGFAGHRIVLARREPGKCGVCPFVQIGVSATRLLRLRSSVALPRLARGRTDETVRLSSGPSLDLGRGRRCLGGRPCLAVCAALGRERRVPACATPTTGSSVRFPPDPGFQPSENPDRGLLPCPKWCALGVEPHHPSRSPFSV